MIRRHVLSATQESMEEHPGDDLPRARKGNPWLFCNSHELATSYRVDIECLNQQDWDKPVQFDKSAIAEQI